MEMRHTEIPLSVCKIICQRKKCDFLAKYHGELLFEPRNIRLLKKRRAHAGTIFFFFENKK